MMERNGTGQEKGNDPVTPAIDHAPMTNIDKDAHHQGL